MKITRTSPISGKEITKDLDVTPQEYKAWEDGDLIQRAMPRLNAEEREFIITGIDGNDEWVSIMGEEEE